MLPRLQLVNLKGFSFGLASVRVGQPEEEENWLSVSTYHAPTASTASTTSTDTSTTGSHDDSKVEEENAKASSDSELSDASAATGASGESKAACVGAATYEDGDGSDKEPGLLAACRRMANGMFPSFIRKSSEFGTIIAAHTCPQLSFHIIRHGSYWDLFVTFFFLGWTSFGGAAAHIAMYHKQFVELRGWMSEDMFAELLALTQTVPRPSIMQMWMSEDMFAELLALTQTVPGPSSTQMSLAIGIMQKGITGGFLSWILFQLPGALIMSAAGFGVAKVGEKEGVRERVGATCVICSFHHCWFFSNTPSASFLSWILLQLPGALIMSVAGFGVAKLSAPLRTCAHPLQFLVDPPAWLSAISAGSIAVAVALIADAAVMLGSKMCLNRVTRMLCVTSAAITFYCTTQWIFPTVILLGGVVTYFTERNKPIPPQRSNIQKLGVSPLGFYMTGSVTYGGGPVMLPLLESIVIEHDTVCPAGGGKCFEVDANTTMITTQQFLAGLALSQAIPGPLFNFAAYLGAVAIRGPLFNFSALLGAVMGGIQGLATCWIAIFAPGVLIIIGVLPYWGQFRKWKLYKRATPGLNATGIGLIWASAFSLGLKAYKVSPFPMASLCIGMFGYASTSFLKISPPLAIVGGAALGDYMKNARRRSIACRNKGHGGARRGTEGYGGARRGTEGHGGAQMGTEEHGGARKATVGHGGAGRGKERHSGARRGTVGHGGARRGMEGHGGSRRGTEGQGGARWGTVGHGGAWWGTVGHGGARWGTEGHGGACWGTDGHGWARMGTDGHENETMQS
ncbi:unnamed protein product [Closterium sp. Naga37s-1]|nr:unnamed protein product [Closterium sp. Naga37s-1]